jgi:hypothetical protein
MYIWHVLGTIDLVMAVGLGNAANLISPEGVQTSAMTVLPMSLISTFAVPLFLMFHFICVAQVLRNTPNQRLLFDRVAHPAI